MTVFDLPFVRGESVRLDCDGQSEQEKESFVAELLERYEAKLLKTEEFSDGVSYYCYSDKLKQGIVIDGVTVNLHLVVKQKEIALGTPIIFGGY